jgi:hypothetical protein
MDEPYKKRQPIRRGPGEPSGFLPNYNFPKIRFCPRGHAIIGDNFLIYRKGMMCRKAEYLLSA